MESTHTEVSGGSPPTWRWLAGFLAVGVCWGFTTPFVRKAAISRNRRTRAHTLAEINHEARWFKVKAFELIDNAIDLLKSPAYAIPLLLNVTGSVWFFLLIGEAGRTIHSWFYNCVSDLEQN